MSPCETDNEAMARVCMAGKRGRRPAAHLEVTQIGDGGREGFLLIVREDNILDVGGVRRVGSAGGADHGLQGLLQLGVAELRRGGQLAGLLLGQEDSLARVLGALLGHHIHEVEVLAEALNFL